MEMLGPNSAGESSTMCFPLLLRFELNIFLKWNRTTEATLIVLSVMCWSFHNYHAFLSLNPWNVFTGSCFETFVKTLDVYILLGYLSSEMWGRYLKTGHCDDSCLVHNLFPIFILLFVTYKGKVPNMEYLCNEEIKCENIVMKCQVDT
jgi:hypothetical protein